MSKKIAGKYLRRMPDMSQVVVKMKGYKKRLKAIVARDMECVITLDDIAGQDRWTEIPFAAVSYFQSAKGA